MHINEKKFDKNFFSFFQYAKRLFSGLYWYTLNTNQKKIFVFNDKYKPVYQLSAFFLFFNYSVFKHTDIFNYFLKINNKFNLSGVKRFLNYNTNFYKYSFKNYYNYNKFFRSSNLSFLIKRSKDKVIKSSFFCKAL